jgi:hypothetical protein
MRSVTGFIHSLKATAFHWGSCKQKMVTKSSSRDRAEYVAAPASVMTEETCIFLNVMEVLA